MKREWLAGGGAMTEVIGAMDWSQTALGPLDSWPPSLRTTVSLCLASNFPINIIWGDGHAQIYNDGYRMVCGAAHPRALGENYRVTWASAWPAIGEPFERALAGETTFLENQRMFLERNGYPEETFFTFSLSPIRDETGKVVGLFHPVTETTTTMLGERRTRALRDIVARAGGATVFDEACDGVLATLREYPLDLPFALLYVSSADGTTARLRGTSGTPARGPLAPESVTLSEANASPATWPLAAAARSGKVHLVNDVADRFGLVPAGPYPEPMVGAFVLPIRAAGVEQPIGFLVCGTSTRLPLSDSYVAFFEMLCAAATAALGNARANEAERARAEALAELDRSKTAFFSNVSHEFRTPLTLLLGPVEDLIDGRRGELPQAARAELEVVHRNGLRLLKLVNALLDFSRVEAGRSEGTFEPTDLVALTRDLASAFRSAIERAGVRLVVDLEPLPRAVRVDREMWEKIVLNLLSNAFKFTQTGEIKVGLAQVGDGVELSVTDTGIGIPVDQISQVFQRFHRVQGAHNATARTHEGSGIGLALVDDLARLHGGSANVQSVVGEGTTFTVRIPFGGGGVEGAGERASVRDLATGASSAWQSANAFVEEALRWLPDKALPPTATDATDLALRPHVLLADDNADMRDYVRRLLADKYRVTAVTNGAEALAAARAEKPDLVLSDVMMPVMDGAELARALRADDALRTVPVVLLSARAGQEETASGLEMGADDYLTKPFAAKELLARVATHLKMSALRLHAADQAMLLGARDEFLAIASHELRTPLTSLRLQVQMAERNVQMAPEHTLTPEKMAKMVRVLNGQVDRLSSLVDDLLDVARIRTGQFHVTLGEADLVAVVRETLERMETQLAQAGCKATFEAPPKLAGQWDARRLAQVVSNLLANVIKYAPRAPLEVKLSEAPDHRGARLEIRDFGAGIPAVHRAVIFDRFDRAGASRNSAGLGLGLFISRQVVRAHEGTIAVEAPMGGGASFVIHLPLAPSADAVAANALRSPS